LAITLLAPSTKATQVDENEIATNEKLAQRNLDTTLFRPFDGCHLVPCVLTQRRMDPVAEPVSHVDKVLSFLLLKI
jgi:hypothetical protein